MKIYDVIILGAGASGLMLASHLEKSLSVAIVDANDKVAKKLKISGGGKCNITNKFVEIKNFDGDENHIDLELRKNRYYFCKNSSDEIINLLKKKSHNANILLNHEIMSLKKDSDIFELKTSKGFLKAKKVVVATGGKSFKNLGASEIGLSIAKNFEIKVKEFLPALVGFTTQPKESWMKELSGLSCFVHIKVRDRLIKEEMLFAHKGISGPAILSASLYWQKGTLSIDFMPDKNIEQEAKKSKKQISSLLKAIDVKDDVYKKLDATSKENLQKIHNYEFAPAGNFGFTKAEVSRGGLLASELDAKSLESKKVKNLYFIGEVVDVTGELGGYNFQWAFSSAIMCSKSLNT